jgi:hypothetical protein
VDILDVDRAVVAAAHCGVGVVCCVGGGGPIPGDGPVRGGGLVRGALPGRVGAVVEPVPVGHLHPDRRVGVVLTRGHGHLGVGDRERAVDEIRRVTRVGGYFLHINEKNAFKNKVRRRFADECDKRGYNDRYPGIRDRSQLAVYIEKLGGKRLAIPADGCDWYKEISFNEALRHLELRLHSEFWSVPDEEYDDILGTVRAWIDERPGGGATVEQLRPFLIAEVFRWSASGDG